MNSNNIWLNLNAIGMSLDIINKFYQEINEKLFGVLSLNQDSMQVDRKVKPEKFFNDFVFKVSTIRKFDEFML